MTIANPMPPAPTTTPVTAARATRSDSTTVTDISPSTAVETDPRTLARAALKSRHSQGLTRLLEERQDLQGVHALADFVHESVRWTA